jgi:hypothetical protein
VGLFLLDINALSRRFSWCGQFAGPTRDCVGRFHEATPYTHAQADKNCRRNCATQASPPPTRAHGAEALSICRFIFAKFTGPNGWVEQ